MAENKTTTFEREYTISLREKTRSVPRYKKTNKAVKTVKEFLARHMKIYSRDLNKIKIDKYLNEYLWFRGIRKPPYYVKVKAKKEGEIVRVELADLPEKLKFKKAREEKREAKAKESKKKRPELEKPNEEQKTGNFSTSLPSKERSQTKEFEDKNKDGVEDKKEESEKKAAVAETTQKFEKEEHKKQKHTTEPKTPINERQEKTTTNRGY